MSFCLTCKKKLEDIGEYLCETCYSFFAWKYGNEVDKKLKDLYKNLTKTDAQLNARRYK